MQFRTKARIERYDHQDQHILEFFYTLSLPPHDTDNHPEQVCESLNSQIQYLSRWSYSTLDQHYFNRGKQLEAEEKYESAFAAYKASLFYAEKKPENTSNYNTAYCYYKLGKMKSLNIRTQQDAIQFFQKGIEQLSYIPYEERRDHDNELLRDMQRELNPTSRKVASPHLKSRPAKNPQNMDNSAMPVVEPSPSPLTEVENTDDTEMSASEAATPTVILNFAEENHIDTYLPLRLCESKRLRVPPEYHDLDKNCKELTDHMQLMLRESYVSLYHRYFERSLELLTENNCPASLTANEISLFYANKIFETLNEPAELLIEPYYENAQECLTSGRVTPGSQQAVQIYQYGISIMNIILTKEITDNCFKLRCIELKIRLQQALKSAQSLLSVSSLGLFRPVITSNSTAYEESEEHQTHNNSRPSSPSK